jgi:hypothetical protein
MSVVAHREISQRRKNHSLSIISDVVRVARGNSGIMGSTAFRSDQIARGRKPLATPRDAAQYIMELPEAKHALPHVNAPFPIGMERLAG